MDPALESYLKQHNINYIEHFHKAVFTVAESKNIKKKIPGTHTKCLFLKDEQKNFYLVCVPAEKKLDIKDLEKQLKLSHLTFGSPEDLKQELNLMPGSVSIFGMIYAKNTALIMDKELWEAEKTGFHPNINTATLEIAHEDLERFYSLIKAKKFILELKNKKNE